MPSSQRGSVPFPVTSVCYELFAFEFIQDKGWCMSMCGGGAETETSMRTGSGESFVGKT